MCKRNRISRTSSRINNTHHNHEGEQHGSVRSTQVHADKAAYQLLIVESAVLVLVELLEYGCARILCLWTQTVVLSNRADIELSKGAKSFECKAALQKTKDVRSIHIL